MRILGIHDVTLMADNVVELRSFYEQLGLELVGNKGDEMAIFSLGAQEFVIHKGSSAPREAVVISFKVANVSAYEEHLRSVGVEYEGPKPLRPGFRGIRLRDPNANDVELLEAE